MISFILSYTISTFISTVLLIWFIVCMWIIFKKSGRKGWESLIPIWNVYILFKIAGKKIWFWILFLIPILWIIISLISWFIFISGDINEYSSIYKIKKIINRILGLLSLILPLMAWITLPYGLTKKFGQSNWFFIGMIFLTPIFLGILAFNNNIKYEGVEFDKKYSLKKWLLITLGVSLVIGCCCAGLKYYQFKNFYNLNYRSGDLYFSDINDRDENNEGEKAESYYENDEVIFDLDKKYNYDNEDIEENIKENIKENIEENQEIRINYNDIKKNNSGYRSTNKEWIDDIVKDYKGNIIMGDDFVDDTKDGFYSVYTEITKRTLYINDEYDFVLKIGPEKIGYIMEIKYNDINEPDTIYFKNKSDKLVGIVNIYPREDCYYYRNVNNWWDSNQLEIFSANNDYFFKFDNNYGGLPSGVELLTDYIDYETINELKKDNCGY